MRIGVDLGGTKIEAVVMGEHTRLVVRDRMATPQSDAIQKRPKLLDTREP
jgi:predicted NBD/HSP70 family sugar kinase